LAQSQVWLFQRAMAEKMPAVLETLEVAVAMTALV
jgi:hypothetical protein